jgi:hypothetical protein
MGSMISVQLTVFVGTMRHHRRLPNPLWATGRIEYAMVVLLWCFMVEWNILFGDYDGTRLGLMWDSAGGRQNRTTVFHYSELAGQSDVLRLRSAVTLFAGSIEVILALVHGAAACWSHRDPRYISEVASRLANRQLRVRRTMEW